MSSFKNILVAFDFEPASNAALDWAIDLARAVDGHVTVLHACAIPVIGIPDGTFIAPAAYAAKILNSAESTLRAAAQARASRGVALTTLVREGVSWETIHQTAEEIQADLIVVGTHGRKGLAHALLGSVAEKTIRTAKRPVVVVSGR